MLLTMLAAMNSETSLGRLIRSRSAFLRRIAILVSMSGGWMSVSSPIMNRLLSRSSRVGMASGRPIRRQHDLAVGPIQIIEGVEQLLLEPVLALDELDVVDQQDVDLAVAPLEVVAGRVPDRIDELVQEGLGRDVQHLALGLDLIDEVLDGPQDVGLAQPGRAVDEQWVVGTRPVARPPRGRRRRRTGSTGRSRSS